MLTAAFDQGACFLPPMIISVRQCTEKHDSRQYGPLRDTKCPLFFDRVRSPAYADSAA